MFEDQAEALGTNKLQKPEFTLNFLWLEKNLGVSVDQVFGEVTLLFHSVPLLTRLDQRKC